MLANLLGKSSGDPSLKGFYENYEKLDKEKARQLRNIRQGGQYLVAICDYGSGMKFEDEVLRAVVEACKDREIDIGRFTEFGEAERRLADWQDAAKQKKGVRNFYADFSKALAEVAPGTPMAALRAGLKRYDRGMMEKFHAAYTSAQGDEFHANAGNLISIIQALVKSSEFRKKFTGLAIFFDEFGTAILQNHRFDTAVMHSFLENLCHFEPNVLFVGCIHKSFKDYAERTNQGMAQVLAARITQVPLANEGIEEIIGAIVETDKKSEIWKKEVQPGEGVFNQLVPECVTLNLFPWITETARIRERVLEDIYGVHPMALHCLLKLSSSIGSDVRSTFTFFTGGGTAIEPGSYADFITNNEILGQNGALTLYLTDRLFEFFTKELAPGNRELLELQRGFVNGYVASVQAFEKSVLDRDLFVEERDDRIALLRMILIYSLCGIPATLKNIQFGRYCVGTSEKNRVTKLLEEIQKTGAIYLRKPSDTYELCANGGEDAVTLVDRFAELDETGEIATVAELLKQVKYDDEFLPANGWNASFSEDKRLKRCFVRARELGSDLWTRLEKELSAAGSKFATSFEGHAVYALCEDDGEVKLTREAAQTLPAGNILVAVPQEPTSFRDNLRHVLACRHFLAPEEMAKLPAQTAALIQDMLDNGAEDGYLPIARKVVNALVSGSQATWFEEGGKLLVDKPPQPHKPADMLCEKLFKEHCRIKHPDLNLAHDEKWLKHSAPLKQAVTRLLDASSPVQIDNGNAENHGEKRYLQKVLFNGCGALRRLRNGGPITDFEVESDPAKLNDNFPVLKRLISRLSTLKSDESLVLGKFIREMREAPVGAGGTMLVLALADGVRAFGERLRVFSDPAHAEAGDLNSYDAVVNAVADPATKLELTVREIKAPQRTFIDRVAKAVGANPLPPGETRTVFSASEALNSWWHRLQTVAKVKELYPEENRERLHALKQLLDDPGIDRFDLLLKRLPELYAGESVAATNQEEAKRSAVGFEADVNQLELGLDRAQRQIAAAVLSLYGKEGDMVECEKVVREWYEGLRPDQRDPMRYSGQEDPQQLVAVLNSNSSFDNKLVALLPAKWGLEPLASWTSLKTSEFEAKWDLARKAIDNETPSLHEPEVLPKKHVEDLGGNVWRIEEGTAIRINLPEGAASVTCTVDIGQPDGAEQFILKESGEVSLDLKGAATGTLCAYAIDSQGEKSRKVTYCIRRRLTTPGPLRRLIEEISALTDKAVRAGAITESEGNRVKDALQALE